MTLIKRFFSFFQKKRQINISNTTEALAIEFIKEAVRGINGQIEIEIERLGFRISNLKNGRIKLTRVIIRSDHDPRFATETFSIERKGFTPRMILAVKWSPNSFEIERYSEQMANAIKSNPLFGVKKDANKKDVVAATKRNVEIEALAAKKIVKHNLKKV